MNHTHAQVHKHGVTVRAFVHLAIPWYIGGPDGNRTRVHNSYSNWPFLRNRLILLIVRTIKRWFHLSAMPKGRQIPFGDAKVTSLHHLLLQRSKKLIVPFQSWRETYHSIVEFKIHRMAGNWTTLKKLSSSSSLRENSHESRMESNNVSVVYFEFAP